MYNEKQTKKRERGTNKVDSQHFTEPNRGKQSFTQIRGEGLST